MDRPVHRRVFLQLGDKFELGGVQFKVSKIRKQKMELTVDNKAVVLVEGEFVDPKAKK